MENGGGSSQALFDLLKDQLDRSEMHLMKIHERITVMESKVDGLGRRLDISNGRTAKNEDAINDLRISHASIIGKVVALDKFADTTVQESNKLKNAFIERALYIGGAFITGWLLK